MENRNCEDVISLCTEMIKAPSYSGQENLVVDVIKKYAGEHGFDEIYVDRYGNCICRIKGSRPGKKILFDGHMDTVPVPDASVWLHDPFGAEIEDGKMYGRGTSDMKGALSAMLVAAASFAEDTKKDFVGDIYISGVVHEECFEGVAAREISEYVKPDVVIIGEASQLNIKIGQRGRAEIIVETFGIPVHSANPEKGVNAVYKMMKIIETIRDIEPKEHPALGKGILELTDIKSSPYPGSSVVPSYCKATYDRRLLTGETKKSVLEPLQKVLEELKVADPELNAKISFATGEEKCFTGETIVGERFFPGWMFDENESYIQDVLAELREQGFDPGISNYNFCTNGSHYAGEAGIQTLGIGPSRENLAHTIDEYIELEQLENVAKCYYGVMKALLK